MARTQSRRVTKPGRTAGSARPRGHGLDAEAVLRPAVLAARAAARSRPRAPARLVRPPRGDPRPGERAAQQATTRRSPEPAEGTKLRGARGLQERKPGPQEEDEVAGGPQANADLEAPRKRERGAGGGEEALAGSAEGKDTRGQVARRGEAGPGGRGDHFPEQPKPPLLPTRQQSSVFRGRLPGRRPGQGQEGGCAGSRGGPAQVSPQPSSHLARGCPQTHVTPLHPPHLLSR